MGKIEAFDLIYAGDYQEVVQVDILKVFPDAIITDASDFIHRGRFQIKIPNLRQNRWLIWACANGLYGMSFDMQCGVIHPDVKNNYRAIIRAAIRLQRQEGVDHRE